MMLNNFVKAERISASIEANVDDLISKLCEDEPTEVRQMVQAMVYRRLAARTTGGTCFRLPDVGDC